MRRTAGAAIAVVWLLVLAGCGSSVAGRPATTPSTTTSSSPISSASTTPLPLGRWAASMAYDQARHNAVLFGGVAGDAPLADTWTWNGSAWSPREGLTISPPARQGAAIAYDQGSQLVILFGGLGVSGPLDDTWAWNGSAWQQLHPAHSPSKREGATATYDLALSAIVLFGGVGANNGQPTAINDTWSWSNGDWMQLPIGGPTGGLRPRSGYLIGANLVERYGDCGGQDNWVYAFDGHTWVQKTTSGTPPPALCLPSLAGNTSQRGVLLFGGKPASGVSPAPADTWIYDGDVWRKPTPAQSPPARDDAAMVYDTDHQVMVLFGGQGLNQGQTGPLNDTWTWDGSSWTSH